MRRVVLISFVVGACLVLGGPAIAQKPKAAPKKVVTASASIPAPYSNPNLRSVKAVKALIARNKKKLREAGTALQFGVTPTGYRTTRQQTKWLESYLYYIEERAWPYDQVNWNLYRRAIEQMRSMKPAQYEAGTDQKYPEYLDAGAEDYIAGTWSFLGPRNMDVPPNPRYFGTRPIAGRVAAIAYSPTNPDTTWYIASGQGGLFKTTDSGDTWTPLSEDWELQSIGSIAVHPTNENIVYVGTGDYDITSSYSFGLMKSTNGGLTWTNLGRADFGDVCIADIAIDPDNPNRIYVAGGRGAGTGGVWRSEDAGSTWTQELFGDYSDLDFSTRVNSTRFLWAIGTASAAQRTSNGQNWDPISLPSASSAAKDIACSKVSQQTIYLMMTGSNSIHRSTTNGSSWTTISGSGSGFQHGTGSDPDYNWSQDQYDWELETGRTSGNADVVIASLIDIQVSRNGGTSWTSIGGPTWDATPNTHNDNHSIAIHPTNPDVFLFGNDGGLYRAFYIAAFSVYGIANTYNDNLPITQFYSFQAHPTDVTRMIGGTQDNGTPAALGDLANWSCVIGADGAGCGIPHAAPNYQYGTTQGYGLDINDGALTLGVGRTTNSWVSRADTSTTVLSDESVLFIPVMAVTNSATLPRVYVGTNRLYRINEQAGGTNTWSNRLGGFTFDERIRAIALAPSDENVIYVGTMAGSIYRSGDAGVNWTKIDATPLPNRPVTSISVSTAIDSVAVTFSGTGTDYVYRCLDTTPTTGSPVWTARMGTGSTALPALPTNWLERDPYAPSSVWYVANDIGVFYTDDAGANWYEMTNSFGLPVVGVRRLQAMESTNRLYAATWGRGIYRLLINDQQTQLTGFTFNVATVNGGYSANATMTFNKVTPPDGLLVTFTGSPSSVFDGPTEILVPGGRTSSTVNIATNVPSVDVNLTVTATGVFGGQFSDSVIVDSQELSNFNLSTPTIQGSNNLTGTVFLTAIAPSGGINVSITSSNPSIVSVPATVTVPWLSSTRQFTINTFSLNSTTNVTLTASFSGTSIPEVLEVVPINLNGCTITQTSITGGDNFNGTVSIAFPAGPQGVPINLSSNNPAATVPAIVVVPSGSTTANFTGNSSLVNSTTNVSVTANKGTSFYSDSVALQPVQMSSFTAPKNPLVWGKGTGGNLTVTLSRAAPLIGCTVNLTSSDPGIIGVPASLNFAPGEISKQVAYTTPWPPMGFTPNKYVDVIAARGSSSRRIRFSFIRP